jgi:hypothetical protein
MSEWDSLSIEELEQSKKDFSGLGMDTTIQAIDAAIANKEKGLQPVAGTSLYTKKKAPTSRAMLDMFVAAYGSEDKIPKYIKDNYSQRLYGARDSKFKNSKSQKQELMLLKTLQNLSKDKNISQSQKKEINNYIKGMVDYSRGTGEQLASNFDWRKSLGDDSTWKSETGFKVASAGDTWTDVGKIPLYGKAKDFENPFIPTGNYSKPKVTQPTMRDVAGPVVKQPIQKQEREKYKDTATTGAKAGYTFGLQSGGKIKKVKSKYAKGGGVRTSKYKL